VLFFTTKLLGMSLLYQENGNLAPGIHEITWHEFVKEFGKSKHRLKLIDGLEQAIKHLKDAKCKILYVDGSFVSQKVEPKDFDACWDPTGVDFKKLSDMYPVLLEFIPDTKKQKIKYGGELFPSPKFLSFFQKDRDDSPKGIIKLNL
jgi:hypothetical protein